jgi:hypothetical protein
LNHLSESAQIISLETEYCPLKCTDYFVHKIARIWDNPDEIVMLSDSAYLVIQPEEGRTG